MKISKNFQQGFVMRKSLLVTLALSSCFLASSVFAATHGLIISNSSDTRLVVNVNGVEVPSFYTAEWDITIISSKQMEEVCGQINPCMIQAYREEDKLYVGGLENHDGGSYVVLQSGGAGCSLTITVGDTMNNWFITQPIKPN
jgi:hypothetical protein